MPRSRFDLNFQLSDDAPTLAHWKGAGAPVLGVARLDPDGHQDLLEDSHL